MNDLKFSIIIIKTNKTSVDNIALNQTFENYEYFVVDDISDAINKATGDYFIFIDYNDTFIPNALANINKMIYLTGSDLIKFKKIDYFVEHVSNVSLPNFQYLFQRKDIMQYAFSDLSEFCIKKDIVKLLDFNLPKHLLTMEILKYAKDITVTDNVYLSTLKKTSLVLDLSEYIQITDYYLKNHDEYTKSHFEKLIPLIIKDTTRYNRKDVFSYCCKHIPSKLIPLKYKFIFSIMKVCI